MLYIRQFFMPWQRTGRRAQIGGYFCWLVLILVALASFVSPVFLLPEIIAITGLAVFATVDVILDRREMKELEHRAHIEMLAISVAYFRTAIDSLPPHDQEEVRIVIAANKLKGQK